MNHVQKTIKNSSTALVKYFAASNEAKEMVNASVQGVTEGLQKIEKYISKHATLQNKVAMETGSRELAFSLAHIQIVTLLLEFAHLKSAAGGFSQSSVERDLHYLYQYLQDHVPLVSLVEPLADGHEKVAQVLKRERMIALNEGGYYSNIRSKY